MHVDDGGDSMLSRMATFTALSAIPGEREAAGDGGADGENGL